MSEIHDLLQNKILRNQIIMAASVMDFTPTTQKNEHTIYDTIQKAFPVLKIKFGCQFYKPNGV